MVDVAGSAVIGVPKSYGLAGAGPGDGHDRRCADAKTVVRIFHLNAHRKALRQAHPVQIARHVGQTHRARSVFRHDGPSQADDFSRETFSALELQINFRRRAFLDVLQLRFAEVRHDKPGARVHQREHVHAGARKLPRRNVEIHDPAAERRFDAAVFQVQFRLAQLRLGRRDVPVEIAFLSDGVLGPLPFGFGLRHSGDGGGKTFLGFFDGGGRDDLPRARRLDLIRRGEFLFQQRLHALEMVVRIFEFRFRPPHRRLGRGLLRLGPRNRGVRRLERLLRGVHLFARQHQLRFGEGHGVFVRPWINHKQQIAFLHKLIVFDEQFHNVAAGVRSDADEVRAQRGIVRLRPVVIHPERRDNHSHRAKDNGQTDPFGQNFRIHFGRRWRNVFFRHKILTPKKQQP